MGQRVGKIPLASSALALNDEDSYHAVGAICHSLPGLSLIFKRHAVSPPLVIEGICGRAVVSGCPQTGTGAPCPVPISRIQLRFGVVFAPPGIVTPTLWVSLFLDCRQLVCKREVYNQDAWRNRPGYRTMEQR